MSIEHPVLCCVIPSRQEGCGRQDLAARFLHSVAPRVRCNGDRNTRSLIIVRIGFSHRTGSYRPTHSQNGHSGRSDDAADPRNPARGWRVVRTLGKCINPVRCPDGLVSQGTSGVIVLAASLAGAPVSTTDVVAPAVVGVGSGERWRPYAGRWSARSGWRGWSRFP